MPRNPDDIKRLEEALTSYHGCARFDKGNRCRHNPDKFRRYIPPEHHKHIKQPIPLAQDFTQQLFERFRTPHYKPNQCANISIRRIKKGLKKKKEIEGITRAVRQMRSELREGCALFAATMLQRMRLATFAVVEWDNNIDVQRGVNLCDLAREGKIELSRAEAAQDALVKLGFLRVYQKHEQKDDGTYSGRAAIRYFTDTFFKVIGLGKKFLAKGFKKQAKDAELNKTASPPPISVDAGIREMYMEQIRLALGFTQTARDPPA